MNCHVTNVDLLLFEVDANHVDLALSLNGVEVGLNEVASTDVPQIRRHKLFSHVQHHGLAIHSTPLPVALYRSPSPTRKVEISSHFAVFDGQTAGQPLDYTFLLENLEAPPGIEPGVEVLQTSALPLGDGAPKT